MPFQDFEELLTYIEEAIEENVERLSECGSDKMFQNLSAVFRNLFRLLSRSQTISQAEDMVRTVSSSAWSTLKQTLSCHPKGTTQCTTQTEFMDVCKLIVRESCSLLCVLQVLSNMCVSRSCCLQVSVVQCKFVLQMLSYSNFSKHLSAVRETNAVVKRALDLSAADHGAAMEKVKLWLQQHNIVGQLLRANLHQKQYVEQVQDRLLHDTC